MAPSPVLRYTGTILMRSVLRAHLGYTSPKNTLQTSQQRSADNCVVDAGTEFPWRMGISRKMPRWENPKWAVETGRAHQKGVSISESERRNVYICTYRWGKNCFYTERQGKKILLIHGNHAKSMNKNVTVWRFCPWPIVTMAHLASALWFTKYFLHTR